jgi:hypothetical protein
MGPFPQNTLRANFAKDETVIKVEIYPKAYAFPVTPPPIWIGGLRIVTNRSTYTF